MKYAVAALFVLLAFISWTFFRFERNAEFGSTRVAVNADGDNRQPCPPGITPSIENIEEYDWIYCTSDLRPFWASLNITENKFTESDSVSEAASTFGELDRDGNDERILRLTLGRSMIRFVILKRAAGRNVWKPLAHLEVTIRHRVVFAKQPDAKQFQFDEVDSDISVRTYRLLCDLENATPKDEEELVSLLSQYKSK